MKRMLIIGVALAVALIMSVVAFADTYDYNTSGTVYMTLEIPVILVLDMGDPDTDFVWFKATAADLDAGFVVRRAATKIGIRSNDPQGWELSVETTGNGSGYFVRAGTGGGQSLSLTALYVESGAIQTPSLCSGCTDLDVIGFSHDPTCPSSQTCSYTAAGQWAVFKDLGSGSYGPDNTGDLADGLVADSTCQGSGWVIMVDYKIAIDWCTVADTYCTCLTYTLAGKP